MFTVFSAMMPDTSPSMTMHSTTDVDSESAMKIKIPTLVTRRAACTHITMERRYGLHQCDVCRLSAQIGWVYVCTQDANSLSDTEYVEEHQTPVDDADKEETAQEQSTHSVITPTLAPGIEKAIKDGQYTPEQVQILRAQKRNAIELTKATFEQFQREACTKHISRRPSLTYSTATNVKMTDNARQQGSSSDPKLRMFPYCEFQACQTCRPGYRDRAWQSIDEIYAKDASTIIEFEKSSFYKTRPLNCRKVMQDIGGGHSARSALSQCAFNLSLVFSQQKFESG